MAERNSEFLPPVPHRVRNLLRRILLAAVFVLAVVPQSFAGTWLKTIDEAQKVAKQKNQLIFVDLFAEWCGWCHKFEKDVFPTPVFQSATKDMVLLRLDTEDGKEGTAFARKYQVSSLPTFLILAPDLSIAGQMRGYLPADPFVNMLKNSRGEYDKFKLRVKNEAAIAKDYPARLELAREFAKRQAYAQSEPRLRKISADTAAPANVRDAAHYEIAVGNLVQKKYGEALRAVRELTARSKSGEPVERATLLVAQIYLEQGNLPAARNEFRAFKQKFPSSGFMSNVDQVLAQLDRRIGAQPAVPGTR